MLSSEERNGYDRHSPIPFLRRLRVRPQAVLEHRSGPFVFKHLLMTIKCCRIKPCPASCKSTLQPFLSPGKSGSISAGRQQGHGTGQSLPAMAATGLIFVTSLSLQFAWKELRNLNGANTTHRLGQSRTPRVGACVLHSLS